MFVVIDKNHNCVNIFVSFITKLKLDEKNRNGLNNEEKQSFWKASENISATNGDHTEEEKIKQFWFTLVTSYLPYFYVIIMLFHSFDEFVFMLKCEKIK